MLTLLAKCFEIDSFVILVSDHSSSSSSDDEEAQELARKLQALEAQRKQKLEGMLNAWTL